MGEVGEVYKDFFGSHAGGKVGEDIIDGDTHTSDAGFAAALARFEGDDVLVVHSGAAIAIALDFSKPIAHAIRHAKTPEATCTMTLVN